MMSDAKSNPNPGPGISHDYGCTHDPCRCLDLGTIVALPADEHGNVLLPGRTLAALVEEVRSNNDLSRDLAAMSAMCDVYKRAAEGTDTYSDTHEQRDGEFSHPLTDDDRAWLRDALLSPIGWQTPTQALIAGHALRLLNEHEVRLASLVAKDEATRPVVGFDARMTEVDDHDPNEAHRFSVGDDR